MIPKSLKQQLLDAVIWSASVHLSGTNPCQGNCCQTLFWSLTELSPLPNKHALKYSQHYVDLKTLPCHQAENVQWFLYGTLKPGRKINDTYHPLKARWDPLFFSNGNERLVSIPPFEMHLKFQLLSSNIPQGHIIWNWTTVKSNIFCLSWDLMTQDRGWQNLPFYSRDVYQEEGKVNPMTKESLVPHIVFLCWEVKDMVLKM